MANYYNGTKQAISLGRIFAALVDKTSSGAVHGLRIVAKTYSDDDIHPVGANQNVEDLFRQAIAVADDSRPALRVVITEKANGTGLETASIAGSSISNPILTSLSFVETSDGEIALQLYSIT